jgi:hypothetical protein
MAQLSAPPSEPAKRWFLAPLDRPDGALDGVRIDFDAAIFEELAEPLPVAQRIADRHGEGACVKYPQRQLHEAIDLCELGHGRSCRRPTHPRD